MENQSLNKNRLVLPAIFISLLLLSQHSFCEPAICTYSTYTWNTNKKMAVNFRTVSKPYTMLSSNEIDEITGCTICEEDQLEIPINGLARLKVCKYVYAEILSAIEEAQTANFPIYSIIGYRVGLTKGPTDSLGNRTQFSNHSYGIAIDINTQTNGLYDNCEIFNPDCRLIKGGEWLASEPTSIKADSSIVLAFKKIDYRWGGEITGKQKDFMHFSPTGY